MGRRRPKPGRRPIEDRPAGAINRTRHGHREGDTVDAYFADPYCTWQRGTNEQANGVMRYFLPKGASFQTASSKCFARIEDLLNNRPRKCLGYRTPAEVIPAHPAVLRE